MVAAAPPDVGKFGKTFDNEHNLFNSYILYSNLPSSFLNPKSPHYFPMTLRQTFSAYTGFSNVNLLNDIRQLVKKQLEVVKILKETPPTHLIDLRDRLVRMVRIAENLDRYKNTLMEANTRLDAFTHQLPFIVRQIAQLFQAIVLRYYGYNNYKETLKETLESERTQLLNTVDAKSKAGVSVGTYTFPNKSSAIIVAKPEFILKKAKFSGYVKFCLEENSVEIGSIMLGKAWLTNESTRMPEFSYSLRETQGASNVALESRDCPSQHKTVLLDVARAILFRGKEETFYYDFSLGGLPKTIQKSELNAKDLQHVNLSGRDPILPHFWTIDMRDFEEKPAAAHLYRPSNRHRDTLARKQPIEP